MGINDTTKEMKLRENKEGNPVVRQKLRKTRMIQENDVSIKDTTKKIKAEPEYTVRVSNIRKHEKIVESSFKVKELNLKINLRDFKKCVEHKEIKTEPNDQLDQKNNEIHLSSVQNHEKLVERKEIKNKPNDQCVEHKEIKDESNDQLNQKDKEVETDVAIEKRLSMEAKVKKRTIKRRRLKNSLPC